MLKKTITYTDFNGNERTEDFFFNLTDAELTEINFSEKGGIEKKIGDIIASQDMREILKIFKDIILLSYGKKSDDGRLFVKNEELREEFSQTAAYSALYMELLDDKKAAEFINGIVPSDKKLTEAELNKNMEEAADKLGVEVPTNVETSQEPGLVSSAKEDNKPREATVVDMPTPTADQNK